MIDDDDVNDINKASLDLALHEAADLIHRCGGNNRCKAIALSSARSVAYLLFLHVHREAGRKIGADLKSQEAANIVADSIEESDLGFAG